MPQKKKKATDFSKLRQKAEEALKVSSVDNDFPVKLLPDEMNLLIHDLQVHQIELEMQNDELKLSQEELETAQARYFDFFNMAPVGFFSIDEKKLIVECNHTAVKMLGRDRATIIKQPITKFIMKEDQDIYYLYNKRPNEKNMKQGCDLRMLKNDGSSFWVNLVTTVFQNAEGITVNSMVMSDITQRKQDEDKFRQNEHRYKKAQSMGHVGNWEYDLMTKNVWASDEAKSIYGFDPESKNFTTDEVENCIPDRERVHQALVDLIEKGQPYNLEFEIRPITGPDKRIIKSIAEIVKKESGMPTKVAGVIHDITVLKLADEQVRKSEEKYRNLFKSINDYILVADINRNIIDCNQALIDGFGYTLEEIIGKKTICLYDSEKEYQEMGKELKKHLNEPNFTYIINYRKKSGEIFPGETKVFYLINDQEETVGFIGIIKDITYRRMVEDSLQIANDQLKEKAATVEDMNTALRVLLQKREKDNQEIEENILSNYELIVNPFLHKLKDSLSNKNHQNLLGIIGTSLKEIVAPFSNKLSNPLMGLTPSEIQIAAMIKQGFSNKEIASQLNNSVRTITKHRDHIREKLNLKNKKVNLQSYLSNL